MGSPSIFQIPGNVKNQLIPFVLNPKAKINRPAKSSTELVGASPQLFSYKQHEGMSIDGGKTKLRFYPSSLDDVVIEDDISLKLLYAYQNDYVTSKKSIEMQDIIEHIPGVQIREFLPDTRLDQCINLFTDMIGNMSKLFSGEKGSSQKTTSQQTGKDSQQKVGTTEEIAWYEKLAAAAKYTMKYMVGATDPDFYDDLSFGNQSGLPFTSYKPEVYQNNVKYPGSFVMSFPYTLYYRLQSCVTTNIYEVPAQSSSKMILNSEGGMEGWTTGADTGFRAAGLLSKIPGIGKITDMILGNIGINYMPWWNAESGTNTKEPQIELKFDLYNDSAKAAMANFIFVNTIIPHNRWVQYNMFQHSSSLYDVKIEGVNRLFACAGNFNVTYEGVLRDPPLSWIQDLYLSHRNPCMNDDAFLNNLRFNKLIKIPDVYKVTMNFQSLLPANFNNYIFSYAQNASHITKYVDGGAYEPSKVTEILPNAIATYFKRVSAVWETGKESAGNAVQIVNVNNK